MDNTDHIIRPTKPVSHNLARTILEQGRYVPPGQNACTIKTIVFTSQSELQSFSRYNPVDHSRHHYRSAVSIDLRNANRLRSSPFPRTRFHPNFHQNALSNFASFLSAPPPSKLQRKFYQRSRSWNTFVSIFVLQRIEIRRLNPGRIKRRSKKTTTTTTTMMMMDLAQRFT